MAFSHQHQTRAFGGNTYNEAGKGPRILEPKTETSGNGPRKPPSGEVGVMELDPPERP